MKILSGFIYGLTFFAFMQMCIHASSGDDRLLGCIFWWFVLGCISSIFAYKANKKESQSKTIFANVSRYFLKTIENINPEKAKEASIDVFGEDITRTLL